jgi:hypothetical protein
VAAFSHFLRDFAINGSPFLYSGAFVCDRPTLFRIVCNGLGVFPSNDLTWASRGLYSLRDSNISILQKLVSRKMNIGIDQCDLKRCSPFIYCLQVRDVHRAKCLRGGQAWVRWTFAVKHGPALEFVLRERKIDSHRLLFHGANNQISVPIPGSGCLSRNSGPYLESSILRGPSIPLCRYFSGRTFRLQTSGLALKREHG